MATILTCENVYQARQSEAARCPLDRKRPIWRIGAKSATPAKERKKTSSCGVLRLWARLFGVLCMCVGGGGGQKISICAHTYICNVLQVCMCMWNTHGVHVEYACVCVLELWGGVRRYRYAHTHIYAMSCKSILYIVYILCVRRIHIEYTWNMHVYVYCRCVHGFRGAEISKCIHTHTNKHTRTHTQ